jgi:hypothetical protein
MLLPHRFKTGWSYCTSSFELWGTGESVRVKHDFRFAEVHAYIYIYSNSNRSRGGRLENAAKIAKIEEKCFGYCLWIQWEEATG